MYPCGYPGCQRSGEFSYDLFTKKHYCGEHYTRSIIEKSSLLDGYPRVISIEEQLCKHVKKYFIPQKKNWLFPRKKIGYDLLRVNTYLQYFFGKDFDFITGNLEELLPSGYTYLLMMSTPLGFIWDIKDRNDITIGTTGFCKTNHISRLCALISCWEYMHRQLK